MNVTAKREDVFRPPVPIGIRGWFGRPLAQIRCGLKALRTRQRLPRPANDC